MSLESDIEEPDKSTVFNQDPEFLKDPHVRAFFCDSMRMAISGVEAFELDQLIDLDLEVMHHDSMQPVNSLTTVADSLPGLGIVAAVLGVVITMSALGGPPEEIGKKVAAALVGTFLGVLLCYGLVGPISSNMSKLADEERAYLNVLTRVNHFLSEGNSTHFGSRSGAARISGPCSANFPGTGASLPQPELQRLPPILRKPVRSLSSPGRRGRRIAWTVPGQSSSLRRKVDTTVTTAAHGKWHTPIL